MPPKKSTTATSTKKASGSAPAHGSYIDMIKEAILTLKERNGSSRQAIQKYIKANNNVGNITDTMFKSLVNRAITTGEEKGIFSRPKGPSGTVKLAKKEPTKPAAKAEAKGEGKTEKKTAAKAKKATATKAKAPAAKKATTTKKEKAPSTKKAATKAEPKKTATKAAAKPKANASKPRKESTTEAPAVDKEVTRVLGKTKSGRVTKTKAPASKAAPKKTATKKAATKKTTPKKAAA
ncbi:hypothetical protein DM02DRAFT_382756 [Periconia macrospinosa]|uniref:Histone H1 n=1 Tax=Periconia macrospinosa TaxID=97972 RepID=A0A2V1ECQ0_9PLEO|nr:hypothetical protein DM02DRAFT_382756 [Periconia macrospinosa]